MPRWPRDNPAELKRFYGDPGRNEVARQLVQVVPPFDMFYDGKKIKAIPFHRKAAGALKAALNEIWEHYGKDQDKLDELGVSTYAGSYNKRLVRGSKSKWSNHAFGAAIDLNPDENGMGSKGNMPEPVIRAFKRQGARWGGDYHGRTDPMHFEFCWNGQPDEDVNVAEIDDSTTVAVVTEPESEVAAPKKSLVKSKIATTQTGIALGGGAGVADQIDQATKAAAEQAGRVHDVAGQFGLTDVLSHLAHSPMFWVYLLLVIAAGATIYWRWRDHGNGQKE